jgi:glycosyltransferase involved in cell wall biosynthesis
MMPVAFVTNDFVTYPNGVEVPGGCCYYRCSLPMFACGQQAKLGRPAFHPTYGFGIKESADRAVFRFDTVVLKLIMFKWTVRQMTIAKQLGQRIMVDVDDAYDFLPETNMAFKQTHPDENRSMNRDHYREVIAAADTVIVSTPFLLEHHSKHHPDVRLVRNGVYPDMFPVKRQDKKPVIGWVGAIPYRGGDLETLTWLPGFLEDNDLIFHHSGDEVVEGAVTFDEVTGVPRQRMTYTPQVPIDQYQHLFSHFDVGIVPLSDIPFNHAKSCIKGLEYAAAGIPFVAAATPEYQRLADMGVGRVASTPDEWVAHLTELLDYKTRRREAAENRRLVERDHSIQAREAEWQAVFASRSARG